MDWQLTITVGLVVLALIYLGRRTLRTWRGQAASCGGCKCPGTQNTLSTNPPETLIPAEQLRLRRR
jgi:hypothetical protein